MRSEGGGFAANIYGAMPESRIQVTSHLRLLIPSHSSPAFRLQGGGGFAEIDDEVAAVLAFVISHPTFLAVQDDETGRCPKVRG